MYVCVCVCVCARTHSERAKHSREHSSPCKRSGGARGAVYVCMCVQEEKYVGASVCVCVSARQTRVQGGCCLCVSVCVSLWCQKSLCRAHARAHARACTHTRTSTHTHTHHTRTTHTHTHTHPHTHTHTHTCTHIHTHTHLLISHLLRNGFPRRPATKKKQRGGRQRQGRNTATRRRPNPITQRTTRRAIRQRPR